MRMYELDNFRSTVVQHARHTLILLIVRYCRKQGGSRAL